MNRVGDITNLNFLGTLDASGNIDSGTFAVQPRQIVFFALTFHEERSSFTYELGRFTGAPFEADTEGPASQHLRITDHFVAGIFLGTAGTGMDETASWSFEGSIETVPEPSSSALLLLSSACLTLRRRR